MTALGGMSIVPSILVGTTTVLAPTDPTLNALVIKDTGSGRPSGQLEEVFDHAGNPIWDIPDAGGPAVLGDMLRVLPPGNIFAPPLALDGTRNPQPILFPTGTRHYVTAGQPTAALAALANTIGDDVLQVGAGVLPTRWYCVASGTPGSWQPELAVPNIVTVSTATTLQDFTTGTPPTLVLCLPTAALTVTLPPSPPPGLAIIIKDANGTSGTNNITIQGNTGQSVEGGTSIKLNSAYQARNMVWDGSSSWWSC